MWCVRTASRMRKIRNKHKVSDNVDNARAEQHCTPPKRHAQRYRETYIFVLHHTHQRDFSQRSLRKCVMLEGVGDLLNCHHVARVLVLRRAANQEGRQQDDNIGYRSAPRRGCHRVGTREGEGGAGTCRAVRACRRSRRTEGGE